MIGMLVRLIQVCRRIKTRKILEIVDKMGLVKVAAILDEKYPVEVVRLAHDPQSPLKALYSPVKFRREADIPAKKLDSELHPD